MTILGDGETHRLILGDALKVLPTLPEGCVDAVVTDPPYGICDHSLSTADSRRTGRRKGKRDGREADWHPPSEWDEAIDPEWCRQSCWIAPLVAWFGHWRKRVEVETAMTHPMRAEVVWAKDCHVGPPCPLAMQDERIWLFAAEGIRARHFDTTVWCEPIIPTWAFRHHKNEKPVRLMARLLRLLTDEGATVLDPFMGSGTTGVACLQTGRRFVGIEIDEGYFKIAQKRLDEAANAAPLFDALPVQIGLFDEGKP
jgi:site-specific DNA-methyltransferase (adenine-specific)